MKTYNERNAENSAIYNNAWIIRAFSKEQLEANEEYKKAKANGEKLYWYAGWLITKTNYEKLKEKQTQSEKEFEELSKNDDFLFDAIKHELNNHEACYDYDFDVFEFFWIERTERTNRIYKEAKKEYLQECDY